MGFVKTREEIERIQAALSEPKFYSAQMLTVEYRTKPEIIRRVLPPGLEPTDTPLVRAMIGRWGRSNCVHAFEGGGLVNFHYKFLPSADGRGLQWDPALVMATFTTKVTHYESGKAKLTLGNTIHDPLAEIEVVEILGAIYVEGDIDSRCRTLATVK